MDIPPRLVFVRFTFSFFLMLNIAAIAFSSFPPPSLHHFFLLYPTISAFLSSLFKFLHWKGVPAF